MLKLKENTRYALLVPTSMGVRITPENRQPVHSSDLFRMTVSSAETNVASVASFLGLPVKVLTRLVKGSPIARMIRDNLAQRHMEIEAKEVEQGGPWGYRHQFNIADGGFGPRGPRVHNDRAGEVGRTLQVSDFDLERIFDREGVQMIHLSGLIAALSPDTGQFCLELARMAKKYDTRVSFDLNHRASFWKDRESELHGIFHEIASLSDILVGNEEDFQLCLGIHGPDAGGRGLREKTDAFMKLIENARESYPDATVYATTLREVISANKHLWGGILLESGTWHVVEPREIEVFDRIGGGDGFVGGMLYAILRGWDPEKWIRFGWATGAMAATFHTDYAQPADEEQVWSIWEGNARVKR
jgi:2-dehydro-3-deoxygluconokinase